jgi:hypothetical protein
VPCAGDVELCGSAGPPREQLIRADWGKGAAVELPRKNYLQPIGDRFLAFRLLHWIGTADGSASYTGTQTLRALSRPVPGCLAELVAGRRPRLNVQMVAPPRSRAWPTRGAVTPSRAAMAAPTPPPRVVTVLGLYTLLGCTWRMATTSTAPCRGTRGPSSAPPPPMPGPGSERPDPGADAAVRRRCPPGSERSTAAGGRR